MRTRSVPPRPARVHPAEPTSAKTTSAEPAEVAEGAERASAPGGLGARGARTRDALLAAARAVAAEAGWHAVTVRRVAERAGCSPALVYEYFAAKDALLLELVRDGFRLLRTRVETARDGAPDAAAALGAVGRAYWDFARDHADLYQVMYGLGGTRFPADETWAVGAAVGAALAPVVAALSGPDTAPHEVERRVYTLWATVHGLVALVLAGRIAGAWSGGQALADAAVADAPARWGAGHPAARPTP